VPLTIRRTLLALATAASLSIVSAAPAHAGAVVLAWTAPGEDSLAGVAECYDLRYSAQPITASNFAQATSATNLCVPGSPGTKQAMGIGSLQTGTTYYFAIKTRDRAGNWSMMSNLVTKMATATADVIPELALSFSAPRPNPSRENASFQFALPTAGEVKVEVFDVAGRHIRMLSDGRREAGTGTLGFDLRDDQGRRLSPGVYLVHARMGAATFTRRLVVER
jgi:hypothetical protein